MTNENELLKILSEYIILAKHYSKDVEGVSCSWYCDRAYEKRAGDLELMENIERMLGITNE